MRPLALCVIGLASCSLPEKTISGPSIDQARAFVMITVPTDGEPSGWAFEPPIGEPELVPSTAPADLYALTTGCPLSELSLAPGPAALTRAAGAALPEVDRYHRWRQADADDLLPVPWKELDSRRALDGIRLIAPARHWCAEAESTLRLTIDLAGSGPGAPLHDVNPTFGVQLSKDEALVGLLSADAQKGGYFRITAAGAEQLQLSLPLPRGAFAAADGETWVIAGPARQLYRGRVETGFTVEGSTRAVGAESQFWIDGAPDGSELFVVGRDGIAEHYQNGRWTRLAELRASPAYGWGAVLWLAAGEALFTTGLDGDVAHFHDGVLSRIRPSSADPIVALGRHPGLGILAGTEAGRVLRLTLPGSWEPVEAVVLHDSILAFTPVGEGFIVSGYDNGLALYHPMLGYCVMGAISDARPILRLGNSVLLVHRATELERPVLLELFEPLRESVECSELR